MKKCSKCGEEKPETEFYKATYIRQNGLRGLKNQCKECERERAAKWNQDNNKIRNARERKNRQRRPQQLWKFGLTEKEYRDLIGFQNNTCAICGQKETSTWRGTIRRLGVDHNHQTGQIRGLLCARCNAMLGLAQDSISVLEAAIKYLKYGYLNTFVPLGGLKKCKVSA